MIDAMNTNSDVASLSQYPAMGWRALISLHIEWPNIPHQNETITRPREWKWLIKVLKWKDSWMLDFCFTAKPAQRDTFNESPMPQVVKLGSRSYASSSH